MKLKMSNNGNKNSFPRPKFCFAINNHPQPKVFKKTFVFQGLE
jgi:hypothetical protein